MPLNSLQQQIIDVFLDPYVEELQQMIIDSPRQVYLFYYSLLNLCKEYAGFDFKIIIIERDKLPEESRTADDVSIFTLESIGRSRIGDIYQELTEIFRHPYPQNRSTSCRVNQNLPEDMVEFQVNDARGNFLKIDTEKKGLLSLTSRCASGESITKKDVICYIIKKLQEFLHLLSSLSEEAFLENRIDEENIAKLDKQLSGIPNYFCFLTKKDLGGYKYIRFNFLVQRGFYPIHFYVARQGKLSVAKWLFPKIPKDMLLKKYEGEDILSVSISQTDTTFFVWLLETYSELRSRLTADSDYLNTVFQAAISRGALTLVNQLLSSYPLIVQHKTDSNWTHYNGPQKLDH